LRIQVRPKAIEATSRPLPITVPITVTSAARGPCVAPVAITSVTIGPGVTMRTIVMRRKARKSSGLSIPFSET
jgi:hypothetical protein